MFVVMCMGDVEKVKELFKKWSDMKVDFLNDCFVCERND